MKWCRTFDKNKHYLEIGLKWSDCKKYFNYSEKFEKLEPQFIRDYIKYKNKHYEKFAGAFFEWKATPINSKIKMFNRIFEIKKKYGNKILLVDDLHCMELTLNEAKNWFIESNNLSQKQIKELENEKIS